MPVHIRHGWKLRKSDTTESKASPYLDEDLNEIEQMEKEFKRKLEELEVKKADILKRQEAREASCLNLSKRLESLRRGEEARRPELECSNCQKEMVTPTKIYQVKKTRCFFT